jgi:hypothetical protein
MQEAPKSFCQNPHCDRPGQSAWCHRVEQGHAEANRDWSSQVGRTLCDACYNHFSKHGTERTKTTARRNPPLPPEKRRCTYANCSNPTKSKSFHRIWETCTSGGKDWSSLVGQVLCHACYQRFGDTGRLERKVKLKPRPHEEVCTNKLCTAPKEGKQFFKIDDSYHSLGIQWSKLVGEVLCARCYDHYRHQNPLEAQAAGRPAGPTQRCSYDGCKRPNKSSAFFEIPADYAAGGWDWKPLAGSTLCRACHARFTRTGKLDREPEQATTDISGAEHGQAEAGDEMATGTDPNGKRKAQDGAGGVKKKRKKSNGAPANGQVGEGLNDAQGGGAVTESEGEPTDYSEDYDSDGSTSTSRDKEGQRPGSEGAKQRGKSIHDIPVEERQCCYEKCKNPKESRKFFLISADMKSGGRDWTPLAGKLLCNACHSQYRIHGSLERDYTHKKPHDPKRSHIPDEEKQCCYDKCLTPRDSKKYYKIESDCNAGGHDWSSLYGKVVCYNCYTHFRQTGTLERKLARIQDDEEKRCFYEKCQKPTGGKRFHKIDSNCQAGSQNWSELIGKVLCKTCYTHYSQNGTLERKHIRITNEDERKCSYEKCQNPMANQRFHKIERHCRAGSQDWTGLIGKILCKTCYTHFRKTGSLERKRIGGREGDDSSNVSKVLERSAKKSKLTESGEEDESNDEVHAAVGRPSIIQTCTSAEIDALVSRSGGIKAVASAVPHGATVLNPSAIEVRDSDVVATLVGGIKPLVATEPLLASLSTTGALEARHSEVVATLVGGIKHGLPTAEVQRAGLAVGPNDFGRSEAVATLATLIRGQHGEGGLGDGMDRASALMQGPTGVVVQGIVAGGDMGRRQDEVVQGLQGIASGSVQAARVVEVVKQIRPEDAIRVDPEGMSQPKKAGEEDNSAQGKKVGEDDQAKKVGADDSTRQQLQQMPVVIVAAALPQQKPPGAAP